MNQTQQTLLAADQNNGIITTRQVEDSNLSRWTLQALERQEKLHQVQRGVYVTEDGYADDFFLLQERYRQGVYSHETALYLLGFSDRVPIYITMTFKQGTSTTRMKADNIAPTMVSNPQHFRLGVTSIRRPGGTTVNVYEIERVLTDMLRPRYDADLEQLIPAFKRYASSSKKDFNKLFHYARIFKVEEKMRTYMAVLL